MMPQAVELSQLRALRAIAEVGNFGKAGERLHLSPPAVFEQVRRLETEVGEKVYQRAGRKLALTDAGRLINDYARRILQEHDAALVALKELGGVQRGALRLGCGPHASVSVVPHLFRAFLAKHPNVELRLVTGPDSMLFEELHASRVDVLLMSLPVQHAAVEQIPLWRCEMVFVAAPGDEASEDPSELSRRPFILYQRACVIEDAIRRFCVEAGFEPMLVMHNDQADSIKELVKLGLGISLLPLWTVSQEMRDGTLRIFRLPQRHLFAETGLIYRRSMHVPAVVRAVVETAQDWRGWLPSASDVLPADGHEDGRSASAD
jgi:DNA-binding transcriptional LysR family regulator